MIEDVQAWATLVATVAGVFLAWRGLSAWRSETVGRRDIELCQAVIEKFYEAEHRMSVLRSPLSMSSEAQGRHRPDGENEKDRDRRDTLFVPLARFNNDFDFWSALLSYRFRMRALFGEQASDAFMPIDQSLRSFKAAAQTRYNALFNNPDALPHDTLNKLERTIWELGEDDKISTEIAQAIARMEAICIPVVRANQGTLLQRWKSKICSSAAVMASGKNGQKPQ